MEKTRVTFDFQVNCKRFYLEIKIISFYCISSLIVRLEIVYRLSSLFLYTLEIKITRILLSFNPYCCLKVRETEMNTVVTVQP